MPESNQHSTQELADLVRRGIQASPSGAAGHDALREGFAALRRLEEQLEAAQRRADDQAEKFQRETLLSNRLASVVNAVREYQLARAGGTLQEQSDAWLRVDVALVDSNPASEPETGTCADCGRSLTTEEAIRSDACPECDPTKPYVSPRYSDEPGGSHGLDSR